MASYYSKHDRLLVSVDCIVFGVSRGEVKLLLTRRDFDPGRGIWSLMGGFVNRDESVSNAARRVLRELTGLEGVYMQQVGAFGEVDRDPGERVVSVAYFALLNIDDTDPGLIDDHKATWVSLDQIPELGFDHPLMVRLALREMRRRIITEPVAFNLMAPRFTLTALQNLHETILGQTLDKRNFRRRILELGWVEPTGEIDKSTSRRGAMLYKISDSVSSAFGKESNYSHT